MHPAVRRAVTLENGSVAAVYKKSGVCPATIYTLIRGEWEPSMQTVEKLTKAYSSGHTVLQIGRGGNRDVERMRRYLWRRFEKERLTTHEAVSELQLSGGRELESIMFRGRLKSLEIEDIARYIVLFT